MSICYNRRMSEFVNNAIFWIEVEKIKPNPYQPRKEFDEVHLQGLADSIRQYGVLQPLVVTRKEEERPDGGLNVEYELIAGERRLRASKLAGVARVPAIIQSGLTDPRLKLELAIIENLQREDLNPVDRALAFSRLAQELGKWAVTQPGGEAIHDAIYRAYFVDTVNIGKIEELVRIAGETGLDAKAAREVLEMRSFQEAVDADWRHAGELGISGVPTFVAGKFGLVGAQPYEMLVRLVQKAGETAEEG